MRIPTLLVPLAVAAALGLAACGGDTAETAPGDDTPVVTSTPADDTDDATDDTDDTADDDTDDDVTDDTDDDTDDDTGTDG